MPLLSLLCTQTCAHVLHALFFSVQTNITEETSPYKPSLHPHAHTLPPPHPPSPPPHPPHFTPHTTPPQMFKKDSQFARSAEAYEEAADMYDMDGKSDSSARKCKEELAMILAEDESTMGRASDLFTEIAEACLQKNITRFHAKGFFMKVIFCQLALGDAVGANDVAESAALQDPRFPQGREGALMFKLIELCRELRPVGEFQDALRGYNEVTAFSNWEAEILIKIKRKYWPTGDAVLEDELAGDVDGGGGGGGGGEGEEDDDLL